MTAIVKPLMQKYIGTKIIQAAPMVRREFEELVGRPGYIPSPEKHGAENGYLIEYEDGRLSWLPHDSFDISYRLTSGMPFGLAVEAMKKGLRVAREGWLGFLVATDYNGIWAFSYVNQSMIQAKWLIHELDLACDDWHIVEE